MYDRIAGAVCEAVVSGRLAVGEKLPTESALARELGVNALTISRACDVLKRRGVILQRRGSGSYVAPEAARQAHPNAECRFSSIAVVLGNKSLSACPREYLFITVDILDGMREVLGDRGIHFRYLKSYTRADAADPASPEAVVLAFPREYDAALIAERMQRGVPIVSVWDDHPLSPAPYVDYDRSQSAALACRHLIECGYRRIGFMGEKSYPRATVSAKLGAFTSLLHEHGLDVRAHDVRYVDVQPGRAYAAMRDILQSGDRAEAFFVDTDYKAMEVVGALNDAGLRVPEDVGIVSYDDVPEAAGFSPPLTTVRAPRREIGRRAAQMLLNWPGNGCVPENVMLTSGPVGFLSVPFNARPCAAVTFRAPPGLMWKMPLRTETGAW